MASKFCIEELSEQLSLVDSHRGFIEAFCILNLTFALIAALENLLVFHALWKSSTIPATVKKVVLESRCFRFCSRDFGPADVWCHHCGNVKKDIEWRPEYCLLLSDNFKPLLFLVGSSVQRIIFDDNSHCS